MQSFQRPENALKRASELLSIGQQDAALKILHNAIGHRRFRSQGWDSVQEAIMLRHVRLCVDEGKLRLARDGLHQYRIISQHANIQSLGKVIGELRTRAEIKLQDAKSKAGVEELKLEGALAPEDLDMEPESPENLLLSTLQIEVRTAEAREVHQALRAVWDVYKMILDLLRTTPKLERVYHETARRAFAFCRDNQRPQEFKRLCDVLRNHFALVLKNRNKEDYDSLLRPELHLETRMQQLIVASELELWRECSATAEDIFSLGLHDYFYRSLRTGAELFHKSRERLLRWIAAYYDKMSKVMWVGENYLFHALAWVKYMLHVKGFKRNASAEDLAAMASIAVLAVLAIPSNHTDRTREELAGDSIGIANMEQQKRMAMLLGHATVPSRESLTNVLRAKDILPIADSACRQLFSLIEAEFTPLKLCSLCQPLLDELAQNTFLQPYVGPLKRVIFHKLIGQLSRVYVSLSIDYFMTHICSEDFLPWSEAEKLVVGLVHQQQRWNANTSSSGAPVAAGSGECGLSITLDYAGKAILFETSDTAATRTSRHQLVNLAKCLDRAVQMITPEQTVEQRLERRWILNALGPRLAADSAKMTERMKVTNLKRLEKQEEQQKLQEERRRVEAEQRRVEEKQERERREEASKRREERRQQQERIKARSETAALMLDEIKKIGEKDNKILIKGKQPTDINIDDVLQGNVSYDDLEKAQRLQLNKERMIRVRQRRQNYRRVCHFIRACREMELPLLLDWQKQQLEKDTKILMEVQVKREEEDKAAFAAALEEKRFFEAFKNEGEAWVASQMATRRRQFEDASTAQRDRLINMLKQRKIQRARERRDEHVKRIQIEAEKKRIEEEQKRHQEEVERAKQEEATKQSRLQKSLEMQRQRDLEIEEKLRQEKEARDAVNRGGGFRSAIRNAPQDSTPPAAGEVWRRGGGDASGGGKLAGSGAANNDAAFDRQGSGRSRRDRLTSPADSAAGWRASKPIPRVEHGAKPHSNDSSTNARAAALQDDEGFTVVSRKK